MGNEEGPAGGLQYPPTDYSQEVKVTPTATPTKAQKHRSRVDVTLKKEWCPQHPDVNVKKVKMFKSKEITCWRCSQEANEVLQERIRNMQALLQKDQEEAAILTKANAALEQERMFFEGKVVRLESDLQAKEEETRRVKEQADVERKRFISESSKERGVLEEEKNQLQEQVKILGEEMEQLKAAKQAFEANAPMTPKYSRATPTGTPSRSYRLATPKTIRNLMRPKDQNKDKEQMYQDKDINNAAAGELPPTSTPKTRRSWKKWGSKKSPNKDQEEVKQEEITI